VADPLIPIGRATAPASLRSSLLDYAERDMPNLGGTGLAATVQVLEGEGVQVSGIVQWRESLTGRLVYEKRVTGERGLLGQVVWRMGT
jgi:hypothetical protein